MSTTTTPAVSTPSAVALHAAPPSGRLAMLTAYAMAAAFIPLPFVPERLIARVRGAVVHDIMNRHGLSLTSDGRAALASADSEQRAKLVWAAENVARQVLRRYLP